MADRILDDDGRTIKIRVKEENAFIDWIIHKVYIRSIHGKEVSRKEQKQMKSERATVKRYEPKIQVNARGKIIPKDSRVVHFFGELAGASIVSAFCIDSRFKKSKAG
jgi:hypothetical protein